MLWPATVRQWGSTAPERSESFPCDRLVPEADHTLFRAVGVEAPQGVSFRWLCQLRAAPYSYDRLDNFGRRSPQELTAGGSPRPARGARGSSSSSSSPTRARRTGHSCDCWPRRGTW
jgi:hypothetical protein